MEATETLADRLNYEPIIFRGSTSTELLMIVTMATAFWLPVSLLLAWVFGAPSMGIGLAAICIVATVYYGSTLFQIIKRGRPDYYYQQRAGLLLDRLKLRRSGLILRVGVWDIGRGGTTAHGVRI